MFDQSLSGDANSKLLEFLQHKYTTSPTSGLSELLESHFSSLPSPLPNELNENPQPPIEPLTPPVIVVEPTEQIKKSGCELTAVELFGPAPVDSYVPPVNATPEQLNEWKSALIALKNKISRYL